MIGPGTPLTIPGQPKGVSNSRQNCSSGNEDELAMGKRSLALPGLGGFRKRHRFSFDRAAASSGVRENFREGSCFLLVGQRTVGIAKNGLQATAHDGRLKARSGSGGRADVD